jgi:O-antigen/teichoic acid export membrane protein
MRAGKLARESIWLFGSYGLSKFGRLAMMLVVAAILSPREYGYVSLSVFAITAAQIACEFGIWQAVVHRSEPDERFVTTAFTANVIGALILTAGMLLSAPWIAHFYGGPEMVDLLRVAALALIFDGIFYVPDGLLRKELDFRGRALPEIAGAFGAAAVTILLLVSGAGILSYGAGLVAQSVIRCGLTLWKIRFRPRLGLSWPYLKEIVSYGKSISGHDLTRYASANVDYLIVGRVLGAGPLGFYSLAFSLANYPVTNFAFILSRVAFPAFAALRDDPHYARRMFLKMVGLVAALVTPLLVVLALVAGPLTVGLLGEKWQPAILPLQLMVLAGISRSLAYPSSDMLRALGFPNVPFKISVLQAVMVVGALLLLASWGIVVVSLTMAVILSLTSWMVTVAACWRFKIGLGELARALMPGIALAVSGALPILLLRFADLGFMPDLVKACTLLAAAGVGMAICSATVCRDFVREVVALLVSAKDT